MNDVLFHQHILVHIPDIVEHELHKHGLDQLACGLAKHLLRLCVKVVLSPQYLLKSQRIHLHLSCNQACKLWDTIIGVHSQKCESVVPIFVRRRKVQEPECPAVDSACKDDIAQLWSKHRLLTLHHFHLVVLLSILDLIVSASIRARSIGKGNTFKRFVSRPLIR
jgi:hypothetical protein